MNKEKESKYNNSSTGRTYGYDKKGGWDIDTSDRTQRTSDSGHIPVDINGKKRLTYQLKTKKMTNSQFAR